MKLFKFFVTLFFYLIICLPLVEGRGGAYAQAPPAWNPNPTPGGAKSMLFKFTNQVWLNPTIIIAKQNFEQAVNVKLLILPRLNSNDTTGSSRIEKAFDKLLSFLVYPENVQGSVKFHFDPHNAAKPFTFSTSDELHCKFSPLEKDTVEQLLNLNIANSSNLNNFTALPFESSVTQASLYCKKILQRKPGACGPNPENEFTLTKINTTPAKLNFERTPYQPNTINGGVDKQKYGELAQHYNTVLDIADNSNYGMAWKAMAANSNEFIKLKLKKKQSGFDISKLVFKNAAGTETYNTTFQSADSTISLSIAGKPPGSMAEVIAYYTPTATPPQTFAIGAFNVQFYQSKPLNVVLVSLNNAPVPNKDALRDTLNKIYGNVFINWNVSIASCNLPPEISKSIHIENSGLLSNYMQDMQPIVSHFKDNCPEYNGNSENTYYLLFGCTNDGSLQGYMPRARNTGFIFDISPHTIAHELGHGAFNLKHIFNSDELGEGKKGLTDNIMDYASGIELYKHQWDLIHDPSFVGWFEGDDEDAALESGLSLLDELSNLNNNIPANVPTNIPCMGINPMGQIINSVNGLSGTQSFVALVSSTKPYVLDGFSIYNNGIREKNYLWKTPAGKPPGYYDNNNNNLNVVLKNGQNNVRVYRLVNLGCHYEWQSIVWEYQSGMDITNIVEQKIIPAGWHTKIMFKADPSCFSNFVKTIIDHDKSEECNNASNEELDAQAQRLTFFVNASSVNQNSLVIAINEVCKKAIKKLNYSQIEKLFVLLATSSDIKEEKEVAILRLMSCINTSEYPQFYALLENQNNSILINLVANMNDKSLYPWDGDNYTNFIGGICWMFQYNNRIELIPETGEANLLGKIISLKPYHFKETSWASPYTSNRRFNSNYNQTTGAITVFQQQGKIVSGFGGNANESWDDLDVQFPPVSPLSPVIIVLENEELPLVKTALEDATNLGQNTFVVPAIFLKFRKDKINNDAIEKGAMIALDVITIYASGGAALAAKVGWAKRLWAATEVAGALGNIGVNTGTIKQGDNLYPAVDIYNAAMALVGIKHLANAAPNAAKSVYTFAITLPEQTKTLLQQNQNLRTLLVASYINWRTAITDLTVLNAAEKQFVNEGRIAEVISIDAEKLKELVEEEKAWKAFGVVEEVVSSVGKVLSSPKSWLPNRSITGDLINPKALLGVFEKEMPDGTWIRDTKNALADIGFPEANTNNFKTIYKDGYKMLNTPSSYYLDADQFWAQYNKPWLDDIVSKKADFVILSDKTDDLLKYKWVKENGQVKYVLDANLQKIKTGFCKEVEYMENLVQQGKYQWDGVNGGYKYVGP